ncbi:Cullin repeat-like-containing domain [Phytophthora cactorum]|nr:Cullin repeat-like-containing domain [Phytophthora cactorum]
MTDCIMVFRMLPGFTQRRRLRAVQSDNLRILARGRAFCAQEQKRCESRLHRTTVIQVRQACCRVLVDEHADRICEDAESFLINNQKEIYTECSPCSPSCPMKMR